MLSYKLLMQQAENRRAERVTLQLKQVPKTLQVVLQSIGEEDYENLIEWIFESSDLMKLTYTTKFLARTFFDSALIDPEVIPYDQNISLAVAALAVAVKFNESRELSEQLTLQYLLNSADIYLSKAVYIGLEAKVMRSLSYVFRYTSPNDYLEVFMQRFPFFPRFRLALPKLVELALLRPLACEYTAEEIFFGAVLALISLHRPQFTQFQHRLLFSLTDCWERARMVETMIREGMGRAEEQQPIY